MLRRAVVSIIAGLGIYALGIVGLCLKPVPAWFAHQTELVQVCDLEFLPTAFPCILDNNPEEEPYKTVLSVDEAAGVVRQEAHKLSHWAETRVRVIDECQRSLRRQCLLLRSLDDGNAPLFSQARTLLEAERGRFTALAEQEHRLRASTYGIGNRVVLGFVDFAIALLATWLLLRSGRPIILEQHDRVLERWWPCFAIFTGIGVATAFATGIIGFVGEKKLSVGADSYYVSRCAWVLSYGSMLGIVAMLAVPVTLLWQLGRRDFVPARLELDSPEGECGVGPYVSVLHTWTILVFATAIIPAILWIRFVSRGQASLERGYLLPVAVGMAVTALLAARLVANAIVLRTRYRKALGAFGSTWKDVEDKELAPDPTIPFIGESWWKLPATMGTMLIVLWQILEWTGAAGTVVDAIAR